MREDKFSVVNHFEGNTLIWGDSPLYTLLFIVGDVAFTVDGISYASTGNTVVFLTPFQQLMVEVGGHTLQQMVAFHGDFYCIEYHKKEVACNGLLFNNIYLTPYIQVDDSLFEELISIGNKMDSLLVSQASYSEPILKSYLQLILALCSKVKLEQLEQANEEELIILEDLTFQNELEQHYIQQREVSFYAERMGISVNSLSKKVKKQYGKSPSVMIQERVILEAKKLLHLTTKPIKEIATQLHFEDEYYFSRYFKKAVGSSPKHYRDQVGISQVAQ